MHVSQNLYQNMISTRLSSRVVLVISNTHSLNDDFDIKTGILTVDLTQIAPKIHCTCRRGGGWQRQLAAAAAAGSLTFSLVQDKFALENGPFT